MSSSIGHSAGQVGQRAHMKGKLMIVVIEGLEGSGKSTLTKRLFKRLNRRTNYIVSWYREPGGTPIAESIREIIKFGVDGDLAEPLTRAVLYLAARRELLLREVLPAHERGEIVLLDRFEPSTIAYQIWGLGLPADTIHELMRLITPKVEVDLVFWLDAPVNVLEERLANRVGDDFDRADLYFKESVRLGYKSQYLKNLLGGQPNWVRLDASAPIAEVVEIAYSHIIAHIDNSYQQWID